MRMNIHRVTHLTVEEVTSYGPVKGSALHVHRKGEKPVVVDLFFDQQQQAELYATAVAEAGIKVDTVPLHGSVNLALHDVSTVRFDKTDSGMAINIADEVGSHSVHLFTAPQYD